MIAGLSESAIRRQISDAASLTYSPVADRRTNVNLQQEMHTVVSGDTSAAEQQVAAVTSTGTNTIVDVIVTEDQATETGRLLFTFWNFLGQELIYR